MDPEQVNASNYLSGAREASPSEADRAHIQEGAAGDCRTHNSGKGKPMRRIKMILHKMAGQNANLAAQSLMELAKVCGDEPTLHRTLVHLAEFAFNAHKAVEALAAEVERLQALDHAHRGTMLRVAAGLEEHSKDVCWIGLSETATDAIINHLNPDCAHGEYPESIAALQAELDAEMAEGRD